MTHQFTMIAINVGSITFAVGLLLGASIAHRARRIKEARDHEGDGI